MSHQKNRPEPGDDPKEVGNKMTRTVALVFALWVLVLCVTGIF